MEEKKQNPKKPEEKHSFLYDIYSLLHDLVYILGAITLVFVFCVRLVGVNGASMLPTLRHGDYLTVYAGLINLRVRTGQSVKAGTPLGTIFTDTDGDERRTVLHFEVRQERKKFNPLDWVR